VGTNTCPTGSYLSDVLEPLIKDHDDLKEAIARCEDPAELARLEGRSAAIK
jgi:hypothetical protein